MEIKSPIVSPCASGDRGNDAHDDEGDVSDDEGEGKTVPYDEK